MSKINGPLQINGPLHSSRFKSKLFDGGDEPKNSNPCKAKTYHGYLGIEEDVVSYIDDFIKQP